jgi:hypothetical protein
LKLWEGVRFGYDAEMRRRVGLETFIYIEQEENRWA